MQTKRIFGLAALVASAVSGCSGDRPLAYGAGGTPGATGTGGRGGTGGTGGVEPIKAEPIAQIDYALTALRPASSCDEILSQLQQGLLNRVDVAAEAYKTEFLGFATGFCSDSEYVAIDGGGSSSAPGVPSAPASSAADSYTTTNLQVATVDEADFVKNDGTYIYVLADGRLQILRAWPAEAAERIASLELGGTPRSLFLAGDLALVYSSEEPLGGIGSFVPSEVPECTYGYDCSVGSDGRMLKLSLIDLTDRMAPAVIRELRVDGSLVGARRVGNIVHTAVTFPQFALPGLSAVPPELMEWVNRSCYDADDFPYSEYDVRVMFAELAVANLELIEAASIEDLLPGIEDHRLGPPEVTRQRQLLGDCSALYTKQTPEALTFLSLLSLDLSDPESFAATTVAGDPGVIYASPEALYVADTQTRGALSDWYFPGSNYYTATVIHRFALEDGAVATRYTGSGVVKGHILNQFSLDEHEGNLRVATSTGYAGDPAAHSTVTVLATTAEGLRPVGMVDDIAPMEDIRAVRFDGDTGYVVTFEKTDPLFVIDLADPAAPRILGELVIPGFSTYIHPMDDEHLLTIGYDADDQGGFSWFRGLELQIMDVSDLTSPALLHKEVIGTRGSTSEAATNHFAFTYFAERGLLALPMTICEGGDGSDFGEMSFSGLLVYRVSLEAGFDQLGGVPHAVDPAVFTCNNWWTESNSVVQRSIFMEDFVYSIALDRIDVAGLSDLGHPLASVDLLAE